MSCIQWTGGSLHGSLDSLLLCQPLMTIILLRNRRFTMGKGPRKRAKDSIIHTKHNNSLYRYVYTEIYYLTTPYGLLHMWKLPVCDERLLVILGQSCYFHLFNSIQ
jgi:hypothetical protein